MNAVGTCAKCGCDVYKMSMLETEQYMMAGKTDMIQAIATTCPKCQKRYCAGCAHKANTKCPDCGVAVQQG